MAYIDLKGKTCPVPVIETKRFLETQDARELDVAVDNTTAKENVTRFLESKGYAVVVEESAGESLLHATRTGEQAAAAEEEKRIVVFVDSETVGRGDDRLGAILMKSFLYTLKDLNPLPQCLIFINAGVKLAAEGSEHIETLNDLECAGVDVVSCGTCLDYFNLKERLRVGRVSNMFEILSSLAGATVVIKP